MWVKDLVKYSNSFGIEKEDPHAWVILDEDTKKKYNFPEF